MLISYFPYRLGFSRLTEFVVLYLFVDFFRGDSVQKQPPGTRKQPVPQSLYRPVFSVLVHLLHHCLINRDIFDLLQVLTLFLEGMGKTTYP